MPLAKDLKDSDRTAIEIKQKGIKLREQLRYLKEFLSSCYKDPNAREKAKRELIALKRELNMIEWIMNEDTLLI